MLQCCTHKLYVARARDESRLAVDGTGPRPPPPPHTHADPQLAHMRLGHLLPFSPTNSKPSMRPHTNTPPVVAVGACSPCAAAVHCRHTEKGGARLWGSTCTYHPPTTSGGPKPKELVDAPSSSALPVSTTAPACPRNQLLLPPLLMPPKSDPALPVLWVCSVAAPLGPGGR